jgi:fumarylacetoacetate (FAA) hydrolase
MKLASLKKGRDGELVVVSRDLSGCVLVGPYAPTLQGALDKWDRVAPYLQHLSNELNAGKCANSFAFDPVLCASPLPRAYQWADGSAYLHHVELVRKARGAEMPSSFLTEPLMYQGASDSFIGPYEPITLADETWGVDFEGEIAAITDNVPMGTTADEAKQRIKLLMLVNDVSLRNLIPAELAKGFGFFQSKATTSFSPVAVTPDELGPAWDGEKLSLNLTVKLNGEWVGEPNTGADLSFTLPQLIAHVAKTRELNAGSIIGSGTISNHNRSAGVACLSERRMIETIEFGAPKTPFMKFGDVVRIEMFDMDGKSIFGAIEQLLAPYSKQ